MAGVLLLVFFSCDGRVFARLVDDVPVTIMPRFYDSMYKYWIYFSVFFIRFSWALHFAVGIHSFLLREPGIGLGGTGEEA